MKALKFPSSSTIKGHFRPLCDQKRQGKVPGPPATGAFIFTIIPPSQPCRAEQTCTHPGQTIIFLFKKALIPLKEPLRMESPWAGAARIPRSLSNPCAVLNRGFPAFGGICRRGTGKAPELLLNFDAVHPLWMKRFYVRVFPWRSSEARLSQDADGNAQRDKGHRAGIAAFLLTTGKQKKKPPALNKTLSSLQGTSFCVKYA